MASSLNPGTAATPRGSTNEHVAERESQTWDQPVDVDRGTQSNTQGPEEISSQAETASSNFRWRAHRHDYKMDWWFASTAIPLLAATIGPFANISSIAALVYPWKEVVIIDGQHLPDFQGVPIGDPVWCYWLNVVSLICGFLGNLFLLWNFTRRIRYIIALPATIILWYISSGLLIAITSSLQAYEPPMQPYESYTQSFWYAIAAAAFYLFCSVILMVNMLGHFLGHYPDTFELTDSQRTLILQTMLFFGWLAGGAAVFAKVEQDAGEAWSFTDALYFCDVTVLTVGFGDLHPSSAIGQGLILPYSVGGIINLSLVVTSIYHSMQTLGNENILRKHFQHVRERTQKRAVKHSSDLDRPEHVSNQQKDHCLHLRHQHNHRHNITSPDDHTRLNTVVRSISPILDRVGLSRRQRPVLMREERDRFNAMRRIQQRTHKFKSWFAVSVAVFAFILVWFIGAIVFWQCERTAQGLVFAEALYFTYISLLTIGYGNIVPKTHAGRCFFVIWSVFSVPIMTVLVGHMGDTFVDGFKRGASTLADFTVLPRAGAWKNWMRLAREWVQVQTGKVKYIEGTKERGQTKGDSLPSTNDDIDPETGIKRVSRSGDVLEKARTDESDGPSTAPDTTGEGMEEKLHTLHEDAILAALAREAEDVPENEAENVMPHPSILARAIATAIQLVAVDLRREHPKQYSWEEWVKFRRLIRLSEKLTYDPEKPEDEEEQEEEEEEERIFSWDWIGEDSPLVSELDESQWILERLCHALVRIEAWRGESLDKGKGKEKMVDGAGGDDAEKDDHNVGGEWRRRVDSRDISADLQAGAGGNGASRKQNDT